MNKYLLSLIILLFFQSIVAQKRIEKDLKIQFREYGVDGCFVLFDQAKNEYMVYNSSLCDTGYIPASTFKIPNSLIALEEGLLKDADQEMKWDGRIWPVEAWNQDQTLRTAMKYSCIWVYIGFAEKIGIEKYQQYLNSFNYGNKDLSGPPSKFWLNGPFRISANQQIDFLRKFYFYELPVSERSVDIVKDIIVLDETENYKLCGKTGGASVDDLNNIMWLVGYLEKDNQVYFYAMNFISGNFDKSRQARLDIVKNIFKELEII